MRDHLAVDTSLADPARDELGILRAVVDDKDGAAEVTTKC